jgi:hypothetical protein
VLPTGASGVDAARQVKSVACARLVMTRHVDVQAAAKLAAAIHAKSTSKPKHEDGADVKSEKADDGTITATTGDGDAAAVKTESSEKKTEEDVVPDDISAQHKARALPVFDPVRSVCASLCAARTCARPQATSAHVSRILLLINMIAPEQIVNDDEYFCLCADVKEEAMRFGDVLDVKIPRRVEPVRLRARVFMLLVTLVCRRKLTRRRCQHRPAPVACISNTLPRRWRARSVCLVVASVCRLMQRACARQGCIGMGGRIFDGRSVIASFYSEEKWANGDLGPVPISVKFDMSSKPPQQLLTGGPQKLLQN